MGKRLKLKSSVLLDPIEADFSVIKKLKMPRESEDEESVKHIMKEEI